MTPRRTVLSRTVLATLGLLTAGCSSGTRPEDAIPDGPLVPTASLEYAANDSKAAIEADEQCKAIGLGVKPDKADATTQTFKCQ